MAVKDFKVRGHLLVKSKLRCVFFLFSRYLWSEYLQKSDTIFPQLLTMLTHFGLACEMPSVGNDIGSPDGAAPPVCYLVPWYFKPHRPRSLSNNWPSRPDNSQVGSWRPRQDWNFRYSALTRLPRSSVAAINHTYQGLGHFTRLN